MLTSTAERGRERRNRVFHRLSEFQFVLVKMEGDSAQDIWAGRSGAGAGRRWRSAHRFSFRSGSAQIHLLPVSKATWTVAVRQVMAGKAVCVCVCVCACLCKGKRRKYNSTVYLLQATLEGSPADRQSQKLLYLSRIHKLRNHIRLSFYTAFPSSSSVMRLYHPFDASRRGSERIIYQKPSHVL